MEKERIIRISRRSGIKPWQNVLIKVGFIVFALLVCGLLSTIVAPGSFIDFYYYAINGTFGSTKKIVNLLWETGILFIIALALAPAFKMKFWNIGGEGQVLMGALGALIGMKFIAPFVPNAVALVLEFALAAIFAALWSVIPTFFKARFNTNETLFTLMMNYIAMGIVAACVLAWATSGSSALGIVNQANQEGWLPYVSSLKNSYIYNIIMIVVAAGVIWAYLKFSQHGYELSVVGGSRETAKYVGINVRSVMIRTMLLTGGICGLAGFLLVAGSSHSISSTLVGGRGFTAVLVSWLGNFSVPLMAIYSFLVSFVSTGSSNAAGWIGYSSTISNVLTAIFFILVI